MCLEQDLAEEVRPRSGELGRVVVIPADVSLGEATVTAVVARARSELGRAPDLLIYNAAMRPFGTLLETKPSVFERAWRLNAFAAFLFAQSVVPAMLERGEGTLIFTGATGGTKPAANSAAFGPSKFALRGLTQALARDLGPKGVRNARSPGKTIQARRPLLTLDERPKRTCQQIHVAYTNIDGPVDTPFLRKLAPTMTERDMLKPAAIAEAYWYLAHQDPSAFTLELDLRPFAEKF